MPSLFLSCLLSFSVPSHAHTRAHSIKECFFHYSCTRCASILLPNLNIDWSIFLLTGVIFIGVRYFPQYSIRHFRYSTIQNVCVCVCVSECIQWGVKLLGGESICFRCSKWWNFLRFCTNKYTQARFFEYGQWKWMKISFVMKVSFLISFFLFCILSSNLRRLGNSKLEQENSKDLPTITNFHSFLFVYISQLDGANTLYISLFSEFLLIVLYTVQHDLYHSTNKQQTHLI